jgi:hypothetical protein
VVRDNGRGLPDDFAPGRSGLGTQIVQALVAGELQGQIRWNSRPGAGTEVVVDVTVAEQVAGAGRRTEEARANDEGSPPEGGLPSPMRSARSGRT